MDPNQVFEKMAEGFSRMAEGFGNMAEGFDTISKKLDKSDLILQKLDKSDLILQKLDKLNPTSSQEPQVKRLQQLWDLVWDIKSRPTEYDTVVFTEERQIPRPPNSTTGLQDPVDFATEASGIIPEDGILKQKFLDLTKHPQYTRGVEALLPAGLDRIVVLPAYEKVSARASYLNDRYRKFVPGGAMGYQPPPRHLILTGVPGIGKSFATSFLLFDRLATKQVTACQPYWIHREGYFLFSESGVSFVATRSVTDHMELYRDSDIWALVDDEPIHEFGGAFAERDWMVIWSASPTRLKQSRWRKESKAEVMTMSPWKWEEIGSLSPPNQPMPLKRLHFLYARYGGVPRLLLETIYLYSEPEEWITAVNTYDKEVRMALRDMVAEARPLSTVEDITITKEVSFKAFFYVSTDPEEACDRSYDVRIATLYISELLSMDVLATRKSQQRAFYHRLMEVPSLRTAAGRIFERLVHQYFQSKRQFSLGKPLNPASHSGPVAAGAVFTVRKCEEYRLLPDLSKTLHRPGSKYVSTERENVYFRPLASNQAAIDSFVLSRFQGKPVVIMFQITIASSHDIITTGIDALRVMLPAGARGGLPHLVFIVPAGTRMQGPQTFTGAAHAPWEGQIKQSMLEFSEDQLFKD